MKKIRLLQKQQSEKYPSEEIPEGVSIESASYMENYVEPSNVENKHIKDHNSNSENIEEEYTPKLSPKITTMKTLKKDQVYQD